MGYGDSSWQLREYTVSRHPTERAKRDKEDASTRGTMERRSPENRSSVDISGPIRTAQVGGKWYVVGRDVLIPARDEEEAKILVIEFTNPVTEA